MKPTSRRRISLRFLCFLAIFFALVMLLQMGIFWLFSYELRFAFRPLYALLISLFLPTLLLFALRIIPLFPRRGSEWLMRFRALFISLFPCSMPSRSSILP